MDELSPGSKAVRQEANRQYAKASRRKRKLEDALADIDDDGIPRNVANDGFGYGGASVSSTPWRGKPRGGRSGGRSSVRMSICLACPKTRRAHGMRRPR